MDKIYISGPISGITNNNWDAFYNAQVELKKSGWEIVNPFDVCSELDGENASWYDYMKLDIIALLDCDAVYMLMDWENSKGSRLEKIIAENMGKQIFMKNNKGNK